jgi:hypothetical protein
VASADGTARGDRPDLQRHRALLRDLQPSARDRRRRAAELPVLRRRALRAGHSPG